MFRFRFQNSVSVALRCIEDESLTIAIAKFNLTAVLRRNQEVSNIFHDNRNILLNEACASIMRDLTDSKPAGITYSIGDQALDN